jgi:hypothetical protein
MIILIFNAAHIVFNFRCGLFPSNKNLILPKPNFLFYPRIEIRGWIKIRRCFTRHNSNKGYITLFSKKIARFAGTFQIVKEPNKLIPLIPEATHREAELLKVDAPVRIAIAVIQEAEPSEGGIGLRRTPPVTEAANEVE